MDFSNFYLICFVSMGCVLSATGIMTKSLMRDPLSTPLWWIKSAVIYNTIGIAALAISIISIFIEYNIKWMLISLGEVMLGTIITAFLGRSLIIYLTFISPIIYLIIIGALWDFWFITDSNFYVICAIIAAGYLYLSKKDSQSNSISKSKEMQTPSINEYSDDAIHRHATTSSTDKSIEKSSEKKFITPIENNPILTQNKSEPPTTKINTQKSRISAFDVILILILIPIFTMVCIEIYKGINSPKINITTITTNTNTSQEVKKSDTKPLHCAISVGDECEIKDEMKVGNLILTKGTRVFITSDTENVITIMVNHDGTFYEFEMRKEIFKNHL